MIRINNLSLNFEEREDSLSQNEGASKCRLGRSVCLNRIGYFSIMQSCLARCSDPLCLIEYIECP